MDITNTKLKVLMLPWLAHGHVSPYLELSKKLINSNFYIYFCSTPVLLTSIKNKINSEQSSSIELVELHLEPTPELPPYRHTTKDLPNKLHDQLHDAFDAASPSFSLILDKLKPDLVIYDSFQPWAAAVASSHGIPAVLFLTSAASIMTFFCHMMKHPGKEFPGRKLTSPCRYFQGYVFRGPPSPPERQQKALLNNLESTSRSSEIILVKTFEELEGEYFDYLSELIEKNVVAVGPLVDSVLEVGDCSDEIINWLDKKDKGSTVLVSFGSEGVLTEKEIKEIALGLELSKVNFFWVLRFPAGDETKADDVLPNGFQKRVGEKGKVWQSWAPQMKILAHPSVGGFITHCGWSSIMESMGLGVPIIALPLHIDQPINAILVEQLGVGVEVWRDDNDGSMKGEEIAKSIRKIVVEEDGQGVRDKAKTFCKIMQLKEEERVNGAIKELTRLCKGEK